MHTVVAALLRPETQQGQRAKRFRDAIDLASDIAQQVSHGPGLSSLSSERPASSCPWCPPLPLLAARPCLRFRPSACTAFSASPPPLAESRTRQYARDASGPLAQAAARSEHGRVHFAPIRELWWHPRRAQVSNTCANGQFGWFPSSRRQIRQAESRQTTAPIRTEAPRSVQIDDEPALGIARRPARC